MTVPPSSNETVLREEVDLLDYFRVLSRYKWLIAATTLLCAGLTTAIGLLLAPVYRAEVLMAPATAPELSSGSLTRLTSQLGGLANLVGMDQPQNESTAKSIAMLKSRSFTESFIRDNNLMPVLFSDVWNPEKNDWDVDNPEDVPTMWDAYEFFNEDVRHIDEDPITGLIRVGIELQDRTLAPLLANSLVRDANKYAQQVAIVEAQKSIDYLNREINKSAAVEVQQAIYRLVESQIQKIMLANVREEYAFTIIDPAVAPDSDEFVWPNRLLFVISGITAGLLIGVCTAFALNLRTDIRGH